jgi:hypothetical protein
LETSKKNSLQAVLLITSSLGACIIDKEVLTSSPLFNDLCVAITKTSAWLSTVNDLKYPEMSQAFRNEKNDPRRIAL